jgi:hypothetical protein
LIFQTKKDQLFSESTLKALKHAFLSNKACIESMNPPFFAAARPFCSFFGFVPGPFQRLFFTLICSLFIGGCLRVALGLP